MERGEVEQQETKVKVAARNVSENPAGEGDVEVKLSCATTQDDRSHAIRHTRAQSVGIY